MDADFNGGTNRLHLHDRGSDVDQNVNSQLCYIKPMLRTKLLAEGEELGMAESLFSRDLSFSLRCS